MKVLAILASPRKGGNSGILADSFLRGASKAGCEVEKVYLQDLGLAPCMACYACRHKGVCIQEDGGNELLDKVIGADLIVLASPVYFYSVSAQMKIFIDRTLPRYREIVNKKFVFILTAAAQLDEMKRAAEPLYGFTDCLPGSVVASVIWGDGVYQKGEVAKTEACEVACQEGYALGGRI